MTLFLIVSHIFHSMCVSHELDSNEIRLILLNVVREVLLIDACSVYVYNACVIYEYNVS